MSLVPLGMPLRWKWQRAGAGPARLRATLRAVQLAFACVITLAPVSMPGPTAPRYALDWRAPEECPDATSVARSIDHTLGKDRTDGSTTVAAEARIEREGEQFRLTVRIGEGERVIEATSCGELAETAAFIVAIAVDPRVLERGALQLREPIPDLIPEPMLRAEDPRTADSDARPVAHTASANAKPPAEPQALYRPRPRHPFTLGGRAHVGVGFGPSPATTAVLGLSLAAIGRRSRYEIEGAWWAPARVESPNNPKVSMVAQLWTVGARGCGVTGRGRVEIPICALAQAGMIHARGEGDIDARRAAQAWVGIGAGVMLVVRIFPRLAAVVAADFLGAVRRGGFRSVPSGDIDRVGKIAFTATAGLQWRVSVMELRGAGQDPR